MLSRQDDYTFLFFLHLVVGKHKPTLISCHPHIRATGVALEKTGTLF